MKVRIHKNTQILHIYTLYKLNICTIPHLTNAFTTVFLSLKSSEVVAHNSGNRECSTEGFSRVTGSFWQHCARASTAANLVPLSADASAPFLRLFAA